MRFTLRYFSSLVALAAWMAMSDIGATAEAKMTPKSRVRGLDETPTAEEDKEGM